MYILQENYNSAWQQLKRESQSQFSCRLVIYVACMDVDSLCAAKILASLLQRNLISYKLEPVVGISNLKKSMQNIEQDISNVILLGCGANIDLNETFHLENKPLKVHVIDKHRPWNLANLFASPNVFCYEDGSLPNISEYQTAYDVLLAHNDDPEQQNDEYPSSQDEDIMMPRRAIHQDTQVDLQQASDIEIPGGEAHENIRKRRLAYDRKLLNYQNQGAFYFSSDAVQIYTLLAGIGETSLPVLWLTVVGVTFLETQYPQVYSSAYLALRDEVNRLSRGSSASSGVSLSIGEDFSLYLLRQWSLYDSLVHSSYVSSRLYLWNEDGRKNLHKILAKMGISLTEAKEIWTHLEPDLRNALKLKLDEISGVYGIEGVVHEAILRHYKYLGALGAGDYVEGLAALLESGKDPLLAANDPERDERLRPETTEDPESSSKEQRGGIETRRQWVDNFWVAWDACEDLRELVVGISRAKTLQKAIVANSNYIFEKGLVKDLHTFRLTVIRESPDMSLLCNPLTLRRLSLWLGETCAEMHAKAQPLVVAVLDDAQDQYLVAGLGPCKSREDPVQSTVYNQFGNAFAAAAQKSHAVMEVDGFDSFVATVAKGDLSRFLEQLALEMLDEKYTWSANACV